MAHKHCSKRSPTQGWRPCFANPGTPEMHLVYEIGRTEAVRAVRCLEENVVTGAADGYARMAGKPAFTLLHVGSGFANGIANLHNAGRANTTMVNVVGANATYHQPNFAGAPAADSGGSRPRIRDDVAHHSEMMSLGVPR